MKIKIGEYDVLKSGSLLVLDNNDIDFIMDEIGFTLRFKFETNDEKPDEQLAKASILESNKGIQITFTNYNNPLGTLNTKPLALGYYKNRNLYFNYKICSVDKIYKTVYYTFLLGEEVSNGK